MGGWRRTAEGLCGWHGPLRKCGFVSFIRTAHAHPNMAWAHFHMARTRPNMAGERHADGIHRGHDRSRRGHGRACERVRGIVGLPRVRNRQIRGACFPIRVHVTKLG
eukprot:6603926-Prymnesium_polylepis.1